MTLKRLLLITVFALAAAATFSASASAGDIADEPCFDAAGPDTATCPSGTTGTAYSVTIKLKEGSGCGDAWPPVWTVDSGSFPPGLSLSSNGMAGATISGTPTEAGNFQFYVRVSHPFDPMNCAGDYSDKKLTIPIAPGLPKLIIGPESTAAGTVGVPYSLPMTANLPDAKTWSIVDGTLPPGMAIDSSNGVISGTPTAAGSFSFTVLAVLDTQRSDTKALTIVVREPLAITFPEVPTQVGVVTRWEVGVPFVGTLSASGGTGTFTWSLAGGALPDGIVLAADGSLAGRPSTPGVFRFGLAVTDTEGRQALYAGRFAVSARLSIVIRPLRPGKVGRLYRAKLLASGGVTPKIWRVVRGPLPRGVRLDRTTGLLSGTPRRAGRYRVRFVVVDTLGVRSAAMFLVKVAAPPKAKAKAKR